MNGRAALLAFDAMTSGEWLLIEAGVFPPGIPRATYRRHLVTGRFAASSFMSQLGMVRYLLSDGTPATDLVSGIRSMVRSKAEIDT